MTRFWNDPKWVDKSTMGAVILLEIANVSQLHRMWTEWTADGQSLVSWIAVNCALWIWLNFYRVITPQARFAIWGTRIGVFLNSLVIVTVAFFRYLQ